MTRSYPRKKHTYQVPQTCNLDEIPMNIYEENSARGFWVQSEREWTLVRSRKACFNRAYNVPVRYRNFIFRNVPLIKLCTSKANGFPKNSLSLSGICNFCFRSLLYILFCFSRRKGIEKRISEGSARKKKTT